MYEISNFNSGILLSLPTDCSTRTTFWDTVHPWYRLTQILNRTESISSMYGIWESSACGTVGRELEKNSGVEIQNFVLAEFFPENNHRTLLYTSTAYVVLSKPFLRIRDSIICDELRKEIINFFFSCLSRKCLFYRTFQQSLDRGYGNEKWTIFTARPAKKTILKSLHNRRTYR